MYKHERSAQGMKALVCVQVLLALALLLDLTPNVDPETGMIHSRLGPLAVIALSFALVLLLMVIRKRFTPYDVGNTVDVETGMDKLLNVNDQILFGFSLYVFFLVGSWREGILNSWQWYIPILAVGITYICFLFTTMSDRPAGWVLSNVFVFIVTCITYRMVHSVAVVFTGILVLALVFFPFAVSIEKKKKEAAEQ